MKLRNILILFSFICLPMFGQVDKYFPLHLGDYWLYVYHEYIYSYYLEYEIVAVDSLKDSSVVYLLNTSDGSRCFFKVYNNDNSTVYGNYKSIDSVFTPFLKFNENSNQVWCRWWGAYLRLKEKSVTTLWSIAPWRYTDSTYSFDMSGDSLMSFVYNRTYYIKGLGLYNEEREGGSEMDLVGCIINGVTYGRLVGVDDEPTPNNYELTIQNYPNPFNNQTVIQYTIPESEFVKITMYDMLGREVETLVNEVQTQGKHSIPWQAKGLSSGVYFAVLKYQNKIATQKIIYQK